MISGGYFYVWPNIMSTLDISKFCQISNLSLFRTRCLSISQAFVILCYVHCIAHRFNRARSFIIPWIINTRCTESTWQKIMLSGCLASFLNKSRMKYWKTWYIYCQQFDLNANRNFSFATTYFYPLCYENGRYFIAWSKIVGTYGY